MNAQEAVTMYGNAWVETDEAKRRALLEKAWADDGVYTDPQSHVEGRDALIALIGGFQQQSGASIVATSGADVHHGKLRFTWKMLGADGNAVMEGIDFGELADDGRIKRIIGFFGPPPAAP
jgi:hypothetical protein